MITTKNSIITLLIISALGIGATLLRKNFSVKKATYKVAIFEPAIHPAIDEITKGFIDTLSKNEGQKYDFTRYNAAGNKMTMRSQAEEILQGDYDLMFTIGVGCSLILKELCAKRRCTTPLVFTAVDNPQKLGLVGPNITGVREFTKYRRQLELLLAIKPTVKHVLLVYDPTQASGLEKDKQEIASLLKQKNITLTSVEIQQVSEIQQKVSGFMDNVDAVMILKDHTAVSGIDSLITLCSRYRVPLLASDLNSGEKGAVLAYGIHEYDSGVYGARIAKEILEQKKAPSDIPVCEVEEFVMHIDKKQAPLQGIEIHDGLSNYSDIKVV